MKSHLTVNQSLSTNLNNVFYSCSLFMLLMPTVSHAANEDSASSRQHCAVTNVQLRQQPSLPLSLSLIVLVINVWVLINNLIFEAFYGGGFPLIRVTDKWMILRKCIMRRLRVPLTGENGLSLSSGNVYVNKSTVKQIKKLV